MALHAQVKRVMKLREEHAKAKAVATMPDDIRELTGYQPREFQAHLEASERRFNVEVLHRRAGKTVGKINKLIERAVDCPFPDGRYAYGAPTYGQAEDITWHYLEMYASKIPGAREEKGKLAYWLPTRLGSKARIRLYGLDSPKQRMRGLYLDGAVLDEFPWIPPSAWNQQIRPMLMDENRRGVDRFGRANQWCDFIFTPFGRNHAYTMHRNAKLWMEGKAVTIRDPLSDTEEAVYSHDWFTYVLKASESSILSADELAAARVEMGPSKYDQEMECSFDAAVEGAIFARALEECRAQGRIGPVPWNKLLPVSTAWDLGWDDATAIWFFQQMGDAVRFIDYYEATGASLDHYADVMAAKGYRYGYNLLPHDVEVHELGSGKSRRQILSELGVRVTTVPQYKPKQDGIPAAQALIARASFDAERCADGLDRLALYRREFDEKNQIFRENPAHDWASHGASALMQCAMGIRSARAGAYRRPAGEF